MPNSIYIKLRNLLSLERTMIATLFVSMYKILSTYLKHKSHLLPKIGSRSIVLCFQHDQKKSQMSIKAAQKLFH